MAASGWGMRAEATDWWSRPEADGRISAKGPELAFLRETAPILPEAAGLWGGDRGGPIGILASQRLGWWSVADLDIASLEHDHDHDDEEGFESLTGTSTTTSSSTGPAIGAIRTVGPTGDQGIDGLLFGTCWSDAAVTYCDPDSLDDYADGYSKTLVNADGTSAISQLTTQQFDAARFALDADPFGTLTAWSGFAVEGFTNLGLSAAPSGTGTGTIAMVNHSLTSTASAYYPNASSTGTGGDAFFGKGGKLPVASNYDWKVFLHELGHALGLKHGQDTSKFGALPTELDSMEFSTMTYRSYVGKSLDTGYSNEQWGYNQSFMMLDIAALQHMYGADFGTNAGDTTYMWNPLNGETRINGAVAIAPGANRIFLTIWDGNGTDTYDLSAYATDLRVDLSPGGHSVLSATQLADLDRFSDDPARMARGNVFNTLLYKDDTRSLIENAIGGAGHDSLSGNQAVNLLQGRGGNDALLGLLGADRLEGGYGDDLLVGGADADALVGGAGIDTAGYDAAVTVSLDGALTATGEAAGDTFLEVENLRGSLEADRLRGDASANVLHGEGGGDLLEGVAGNDILLGGAGDDTLLGGAGNDTLNGEDGLDRLEGGLGDDHYVLAVSGDTVIEAAGEGIDQVSAGYGITLGANLENLLLTGTSAIGGSGNALANRITGNGAANTLQGLDGDDQLEGVAGNDTLYGGNGNDRLTGGAGADRLSGGAGADGFVFHLASESGTSSSTRDTVTDFLRGTDRIVLSSLDANVGLSGDQAFVLDTNKSFSTGEIRQTVTKGNLLLEFNTDGDRYAEMSILLTGVKSPLGIADFDL